MASAKHKLKVLCSSRGFGGNQLPCAVKIDLLERKNYSDRKRLVGGFYAYENVEQTKQNRTAQEKQIPWSFNM